MKHVTDKDVAIIILNWNAYCDTFECLKSIELLTYNYFRVFLVDNASQDGSFDRLKQDYKNGKFNIPITFIQSGENLGFAGGNNIAIKEAYEQGYRYFWMLNNDTVIDPNALTPLVEILEKDKQVGIVGSKIYYYGTNKIWFAGGKINTWTGKVKHLGFEDIDSGQNDKIKEVDYITGCSLCFKKEIIEQIGYMNEDYFLYYEETEWNIRAKNKKWKIMYIPDSIVYHKVSTSSGGTLNLAPYVAYYDIRNAFIMIKRTQNKLKIFTAFIYLNWKLLKNILKLIIKNQDNKFIRLKYIWQGLIDSINENMGFKK